MSILWYAGRGLQAFMLLALVAILLKLGDNPYLAGQITGKIFMNLILTEVCIRFSQPKENQSPSGCNIAAGGCLTLLVLGGLAGFVIGIKAAMGAGRPPLAAHSGPNKVYSVKLPEGATYKKESRMEALPQGKVKVNGEIWEKGDEGGVMGVADIPLIRTAAASTYGGGYRGGMVRRNQGLGRALSDDEVLDAVCQSQIAAIQGEPGNSKAVNRLGNRGREVDFTVPSKKLQGRILYLWGNRRLYFCLYASGQTRWDETRATSVLNSFRFSMVR
ncbi:MAG: hypothetical protein KF760_25240 [Candidatus Eremiobacteraeota bacterium]|nr:hypothetical protein [Candidatus Eremiobacteraeota bacterium]MCW5872165.1 hypothetical protein [Candidatus Eremiobacteraeota bacterium]